MSIKVQFITLLFNVFNAQSVVFFTLIEKIEIMGLIIKAVILY